MGRNWVPRTVPVEPFQKRLVQLEREGVTAADIARKLGWKTNQGAADGPRVRRTVGLRDWHREQRQGPRSKRVTLETAERLADALDLAPHEVGL